MIKHCGRFRIPGFSRYQRLATGSVHISGNQQQVEPLHNRSFCKQTEDAFTLDWSQLRAYAFPLFTLIGRCLKQVLRQSVSQLAIVAPVWETQPWYSLLLEMTVDYPILLPSFPGPLRQENELHPLVNLQLAAWLVSGVNMKVQQFHSQLRDCLWLHGEPGQKKTYSSAWRKRTCWCCERQVDPLSASLDLVLNFLAIQFEAGLEYRTLNVYRSALSATHPQIEGFKVGEHPFVVSY